MTTNKIKQNIIKFWKFMQEDSLKSLLVFFIIAIIFIKFILFPGLSLLTGTPLPLVIVESCSMYHQENGFDKAFEKNIYQQNGIKIEDTKNWDFKNGLNKGDVIFVMGIKEPKIGDVIIFNGGENHPIIHRIVDETEPYGTFGDNNPGQLTTEKSISKSQLTGKAIFKIPYIGWIKLIFFEHTRKPEQRGFCK